MDLLGKTHHCAKPWNHRGGHESETGVCWEDTALDILTELLAGADDHRCWYIPDEIAGRARRLVSEHAEMERE